MASLISGYEYDIFISYRQKDNKHYGWITEFVDNLKGELESTFKEEISVYFDIDPHDGLLETHDVDASLKDKLKCLVFIPIISRTYCDPKSFAWEHEFKSFVEQASHDHFGLKIKLPNGNVASRVLPIRINDLDISDTKLCESILGGVFRGIDFIYKEPGVNRPLRSNEDNPHDNLNHTIYRNQINKVANAIGEIISSLKSLNIEAVDENILYKEAKAEIKKENQRKGLLNTAIFNQKSKKRLIMLFLMISCVIGTFLIFKITGSSKQIQKQINANKTIAILPFRNLSNDTTQLYFCDGFMEELLNNLQKIKSFIVRSRTSSDQYRDTRKSTTTISNELNVNYLIEGSVGREGNNLKIWVQLIDSKADKPLWSSEYLREMTIVQIFSLQSEIAKAIATELKTVLTAGEIGKIEKRPTENLEAFNYYLQGNYYYWKSFDSQDFETAISLYKRAIELDPRFAIAFTRLAMSQLNQYWFYHDYSEDLLHNSKHLIDKAFEIDPDLPEAHLALGFYYYYGYLGYSKALEESELVLKDQPENSEAMLLSAAVYRRAGDWEMAKSYFVKAFELDPKSSRIAFNTGKTFDLLRDYPKALQYYNITLTLNPDWIYPYYEISQLYLKLDGNTIRARELLENKAWNNKSLLIDSLIIEVKILINIYDGKYEEALKDLSKYRYNIFQTQWYLRPKYLYYANIYGLMNKPELEHVYYDSTRIFLEKRIIDFPEDQRLYSSLGIAYAGLGLKEKAIITSEKAVRLFPVKKEAMRGIYSVENLAQTYIMLKKYPEALEQIKYLLSIPGNLTTKILELDPRWAPLKNQPDFKKILKKYTVK